ncbi:MAG: type II toxin-antitoxin system HicA family toxin [Armatimonadota bacterium]|nr:type II toxin-antitoxin system HicA family toxin [Armatimonadota bacterium]
MTAREVLRTLQRMGFLARRQTGSHIRLVHPGKPDARVTVSMHPGDLSENNLMSILRQAGISRKEFERAWRRK